MTKNNGDVIVSSCVELTDLSDLYIFDIRITKDSPHKQKVRAVNKKLQKAPPIDFDDPVAVQKRIDDFFDLCSYLNYRPGFCTLGAAVGKDRKWLWALRNGKPTGGSGYEAKLRPEVADILKKAYDFVEENLESGLINNAGGIGEIFILKNSAGYTDKTEHVITPNSNTEEIIDTEEIRKRYLPETYDKSEE